VNAPEIERIFERLREAEHGAIIKLGVSDTGEPVEGIIFEPSFKRPPGFESGIFITIPSESEKVYYLDPEASKEEGRLIIKELGEPVAKPSPEDLLKEFEHVRNAPGVKRGGGTTGEACSKAKGIIDVG
jgi:hypothetical protein